MAMQAELAKRGKRWCFTLNNYSTEDILNLKKLEGDLLSYVVYGKEVAPSTGTPHLQGYLELTTKKVGRALSKLIPNAVLISAKGTAAQNTTYCSKGGQTHTWGTPMKQGKRKDLAQIQDAIRDGATDIELAELNFSAWLRYNKSFAEYRRMTKKLKRDWMPEIHIYWGDTGAGKTRKVYDAHDHDDIWVWNGNHKFYQGYSMQKICLFDDFYGEISLSYMLKLCDRYPMLVNIKQGECNWQPEVIYFTSNVDPRQWKGWEDKPQAVVDAFFRRVKEKGSITHFTKL